MAEYENSSIWIIGTFLVYPHNINILLYTDKFNNRKFLCIISTVWHQKLLFEILEA